MKKDEPEGGMEYTRRLLGSLDPGDPITFNNAVLDGADHGPIKGLVRTMQVLTSTAELISAEIELVDGRQILLVHPIYEPKPLIILNELTPAPDPHTVN